MIPCSMFFRPDWRPFLHPREGWGGESDYRWAGGLGTFVALAGVPAVLRHARLRGRHPRPVVGDHCQPLLQTVNPPPAPRNLTLTMSAIPLSWLKCLFVSSYKKASMWNAVVGVHDLENANESCHQVSDCVCVFTSVYLLVWIWFIFAIWTLLCVWFEDRKGGKNHLPQGLQPKDEWEWYCPAETAESAAVQWVCEACWHLKQRAASSGDLHCHRLGRHQREYGC